MKYYLYACCVLIVCNVQLVTYGSAELRSIPPCSPEYQIDHRFVSQLLRLALVVKKQIEIILCRFMDLNGIVADQIDDEFEQSISQLSACLNTAEIQIKSYNTTVIEGLEQGLTSITNLSGQNTNQFTSLNDSIMSCYEALDMSAASLVDLVACGDKPGFEEAAENLVEIFTEKIVQLVGLLQNLFMLIERALCEYVETINFQNEEQQQQLQSLVAEYSVQLTTLSSGYERVLSKNTCAFTNKIATVVSDISKTFSTRLSSLVKNIAIQKNDDALLCSQTQKSANELILSYLAQISHLSTAFITQEQDLMALFSTFGAQYNQNISQQFVCIECAIAQGLGKLQTALSDIDQRMKGCIADCLGRLEQYITTQGGIIIADATQLGNVVVQTINTLAADLECAIAEQLQHAAQALAELQSLWDTKSSGVETSIGTIKHLLKNQVCQKLSDLQCALAARQSYLQNALTQLRHDAIGELKTKLYQTQEEITTAYYCILVQIGALQSGLSSLIQIDAAELSCQIAAELYGYLQQFSTFQSTFDAQIANTTTAANTAITVYNSNIRKQIGSVELAINSAVFNAIQALELQQVMNYNDLTNQINNVQTSLQTRDNHLLIELGLFQLLLTVELLTTQATLTALIAAIMTEVALIAVDVAALLVLTVAALAACAFF